MIIIVLTIVTITTAITIMMVITMNSLQAFQLIVLARYLLGPQQCITKHSACRKPCLKQPGSGFR